MPPRKRPRSIWSALSETNAVSYTPSHTRATTASDAVVHLTLVDKRHIHAPKTPRTLFPSEDITHFHEHPTPPPANHSPPSKKKRPSLPTNLHHEQPLAHSFGSFSSPTPPPVESRAKSHAIPETIEESPARLQPATDNVETPRPQCVSPSTAEPTPVVDRTFLLPVEQHRQVNDSTKQGNNVVMPSVASPSVSAKSLSTPSVLPVHAQKTGISPDSSSHYTPLMITTSAIRRAQEGLGLTPDACPNSAIVTISREQEQELRAIQASARKMMFSSDDLSSAPSSSHHQTPSKSPLDDPNHAANHITAEKHQPVSTEKRVSPKDKSLLYNTTDSTPAITKRRLSVMSSVTPIPLNFESPATNKDTPNPNVSTTAGKNTAIPITNMPLFTNGKGVPLPAVKRVQTPSPITPAATRRTSFPAVKTSPNTEHPNNSTTKADEPIPFLFTTGKGVPLHPPRANKIGESILGPTTSADKTAPKPPAAPSLFTTGSGKKVTVPTLKSSHGGSSKALDFASLFSTGSGKPVPVLEQKKTPTRLARPPVNLHAPLVTPGPKKNIPIVGGKLGSIHEERTPRQRVRNVASSSRALKTTPFKRPRRVSKPHFSPGEPGSATKKASTPVPKFSVPRLLRNGFFECANHGHVCKARGSSPPSYAVPTFVTQVGSLRGCLDYVFDDVAMGSMECHSSEVLKYFKGQDMKRFGVQNCIEWIKVIFPDVALKPATCIGSIAWTKLAYALAVWKLGRLDLKHSEQNRSTGCRFLCAANVVREFLRRISYEWTQNRQPHLLRIMRRDSAAASHTVLLVGDLEDSQDVGLGVILSDGWYVARAAVDATVERRIRRGKIRIGDPIHLSGAGLDSINNGKAFFFGDGDEITNGILKICANNVQKLKHTSFERLGMQRYPLVMKSFKSLVEDGGQCPTVKAVILRSYPIFYVETVADDTEEGGTRFIFRREDAEFEARAAFEEQARQKLAAAVDKMRKSNPSSVADLPEVTPRDVRNGKEILVCGIDDDPADGRVRKLVRIYNPTEDIENYLSQEGQVVFLSQMWPKRHAWNCKPQGISPVVKGSTTTGFRILDRFPRRRYRLEELRDNSLKPRNEFDGVFCVLHVAEMHEGSRFIYLTDAPDVNDIQVLALEMSGYDSQCLPRQLRFRPGLGRGTKFPIVAIQDVEFMAFNRQHSLVHARASFRSSFISRQGFPRKHEANSPLAAAFSRLEDIVRCKEDVLEKMRDAVIAFSSGYHVTIGAYFTSTQDM